MTTPERPAAPAPPRDRRRGDDGCPGILIVAGGMPSEFGSRLGFQLVKTMKCPQCFGEFTRWIIESDKLKHKQNV